MDQKRVYELARELKISPQALISILKDMNIVVKSHMSYIDNESVEKINKMFSKQMEEAKARQKRRKSYQQQLRSRKFQKTKKPVIEKPKVLEEKVEKEPLKEKEYKKPSVEKVKAEVEKTKPTSKGKPPTTKPVTEKKKAKVRYKDKKTRLREEREKRFFDQQQLKGNIKAILSKDSKTKKYKKDKVKIKEETHKIIISEFTSAAELAKMMDKKSIEIVAKFMELGKMITINQRLDKESLIMICDEFNFEVGFADQYGSDILSKEKKLFEKEDVKTRPPVVAVMGHVDHGKTSILDYIRKTNVIAGEAGGITQHIGAYQVEHNEHKISFIDTPGHEAFTAMRARGADITDIAVIVIAADDGVMPQTVEAIDHARAAGMPLIIAINKIDLPNTDIEKTKIQLGQQNIRLQGWGGSIEYVECSAKTGEGIDSLLETILLVAEVEELSARYTGNSEGVVIEAKLDKGKGPIATILVKNGILKTGDIAICGAQFGKIRLMLDERMQPVNICYPSGVVQILGLNSVPQAGDTFNIVQDEKNAREITSQRQFVIRQRQIASSKGVTLDNLFDRIQQDDVNSLNIIVKSDTDGSVEAICDALQKIRSEEIEVNIIHKAVGGIVEADANLAAASNAIIIGFHVRPNVEARKAAELNKAEIRLYDVIFEAIDDVKKSIEGLLSPVVHEEIVGSAEVKQTFKISKVGVIAGCIMTEGKITNDVFLRLFRENVKVYDGKIATLRRFQNEVKEVNEGQECGIAIENFNDIKVGDVIEAYIKIEERKKIV